jgi:pSer/pThr/pTyr-binding forkhead associated (FHA) protein
MPSLTLYHAHDEPNRVELLGPVTIGRQAGLCDIATHDPKVSRRHCRIEPVADGWLLTDLRSSNGTWVGQTQVSERLLQDGDEIRVGDTIVRYFEHSEVPRQRPVDPNEALQLARAGREQLATDDFAELAPRPMPRAWERVAEHDSPGLSDTQAG